MTMDEEAAEEAFLEKFKRSSGDPRPAWALHPDPSGSLDAALESVPLFMNAAPTPDAILNNSTLLALQSLLYTDGTPEEIADNFREQGNTAFKEKRNEDALLFYQKGLQVAGVSSGLVSKLLGNRAAVLVSCERWTEAMSDCKRALRADGQNEKARIRGVRCALVLKEMQFLTEYIRSDDDQFGLVQELRAKIDRETEERGRIGVYLSTNFKLTFDERAEAGILASLPTVDWSSLPNVSIANGKSVWPVIILYPEHGQCDFVERFPEDDTFLSQLKTLFETSPPWDLNRSYSATNLSLYVLQQNTQSLTKLNTASPLKVLFPKIISAYNKGVIALYALPKNNRALIEEFTCQCQQNSPGPEIK